MSSPSLTPSPQPWTTHTANLELYDALSTSTPNRPALPPEVLLEILSHPSRHIITHTALFPAPEAIENRPIRVPSSRSPCTILTAGPLTQEQVRKVQKIVFTFTGKDQGYSSYRQDYGTYKNTWSWFEAHVRRSRDGPARRSVQGKRKTGGEETGSGREPEQQAAGSEPGEERKWELQRNRNAGKEPEAYTVKFEEGDALLAGLREGDCVDLVACAMFGEWECQVYEAGIEVWCVDDLAEGVGGGVEG